MHQVIFHPLSKGMYHENFWVFNITVRLIDAGGGGGSDHVNGGCDYIAELTRRAAELVQQVEFTLHVLNLIWFGNISRLSQWGGGTGCHPPTPFPRCCYIT